MSTDLFDKADEYDAMLEQGLRLSGENRDFFAQGRVAHLATRLANAPREILDFGCGTGDTTSLLATTFPDARILGVDGAERAIEHACEAHAGPRVRFGLLDAIPAKPCFDLCYTNGVFHHIRPEDRPGALARIRAALRPGGRLALFENNAWHPGARLVMHRIPFDADAVPISPRGARRLLAASGFEPEPADYLFVFPHALSALRGLEPALRRVPLGAQYLVLATRP